MARLDRSAEVREVAQFGACIGRDFSYRLLAAVSDLPEGKLRSALDQLIGSELVFSRGEPPDATYRFKHALVQDAAYGSLLRSRRQILHRLLAEILQSQFPERIANEPELAAHHFTSAGLNEQAIGYWLLAGHRAIERFANAEAISHVTRGFGPSPNAARRNNSRQAGVTAADGAGQRTGCKGLYVARSRSHLRPRTRAVSAGGGDAADVSHPVRPLDLLHNACRISIEL